MTVITTSGGPSTPLASAYTYNTPPTVTSVTPNNGPQAGTNTVTVAGSGFVSGSTSVEFGSTAGTSVSVTNSASLTVVVPAGTGTVSVTVSTTAGGASTPLANAYTYSAPAISVVKSVTSSGPYNAVGQTVSYQFVATNIGNVTLSSVGITDTQTAPAGRAYQRAQLQLTQLAFGQLLGVHCQPVAGPVSHVRRHLLRQPG